MRAGFRSFYTATVEPPARTEMSRTEYLQSAAGARWGRPFRIRVLALLLAGTLAPLACAQNKRAYRPAAVTGREPLFATVSGVTATPGAISFSSPDPDTGTVALTPAVVSWTASDGNNARNWILAITAGSASFTGCATVPASAIQVTCSSVEPIGGSGTCSNSFPLSAAYRQIAGGVQGDGARNYTVNVAFTFTDSWRYRAALSPACTLSLTYLVIAP